jgi:hypothetical protein
MCWPGLVPSYNLRTQNKPHPKPKPKPKPSASHDSSSSSHNFGCGVRYPQYPHGMVWYAYMYVSHPAKRKIRFISSTQKRVIRPICMISKKYKMNVICLQEAFARKSKTKLMSGKWRHSPQFYLNHNNRITTAAAKSDGLVRRLLTSFWYTLCRCRSHALVAGRQAGQAELISFHYHGP